MSETIFQKQRRLILQQQRRSVVKAVVNYYEQAAIPIPTDIRSKLERKRYLDNKAQRISHSNTRNKILSKLGAVCVRCGETDEKLLHIDHVYGGGGIERKAMSRKTYYKKILDDTTGSYQILCRKCNHAKRKEDKVSTIK